MRRPAIFAVRVLVTLLLLGCTSGTTSPQPGTFIPTAPTTSVPGTADSPDPSSARSAGAGSTGLPSPGAVTVHEFAVPAGSHPHDVAPAADGTVWYTAQAAGKLGRLDPATGQVREIPLGAGSAPHGVIVGPDGAPWVTDGGLNAIVRVDAATHAVKRYPLPARAAGASLNTATFDPQGVLWFTGQNGWYGRLDVTSGHIDVYEAPKGRGPYGIASAPGGGVAYASLAGSYIGIVETRTGRVGVVDTPTPGAGARRIWFDSDGNAYITEWFAGRLGMYAATMGGWREWRMPGADPQPYAVYVDDRNIVWVTDFGSNSIVRFDPRTERFDPFGLPSAGAGVRQLLGRPGEVWGAESGTDKLVLLRTGG